MYEVIMNAYSAFVQTGVQNPFYETIRLVDLALNGKLRKADLSSLGQVAIDLNHIAQKRKDGMPLEYIVSRASFAGLLLHCSPATLIPREETRLLADVALSFIKGQENGRTHTVIDMGTGSGNLAVYLTLHSENTNLLATDISPEAIEVARTNVNEYSLQERIQLFCGDLFSPFVGSKYESMVDMVVCNPPYIPSTSMDRLAPEIVDFEPKVALDAGAYGLALYRRLFAGALQFLRPLGVLVFEIGAGQNKLVTRLLQRNPGYQDIKHYDDGEQVRVISAIKTENGSEV